MSQQWPGTPVGAQAPQQPVPASPPPFIPGRVDPYKQSAEQRAQQDQAMQAQRDALTAQTERLRQEGLALENQQKKDKLAEGGTKGEYSQGALDAFDRALSSIKTIRDHPGMSAAVGSGFDPNAWGSYNPFSGQAFGGTDAAGFEARLEALKSQTFLPMVQALKGMGALSNAEGDKLTASIGALDPKMPEGDFLASLREIETNLQRYKERGAGGDLAKNDAIRAGYQKRIGEGQSAGQIAAWLKTQGQDVNMDQVKAAVEFRRTHPDIDVSRYLLNIGTAPPQAAPASQSAPASDIDAILRKHGVVQ